MRAVRLRHNELSILLHPSRLCVRARRLHVAQRIANFDGRAITPALTHENRRMDIEFTIAWIKNPNPPMPKLYPSPLSEQDVVDVAAYVESL